MPTFFINSDSFKASNAFVATLGAAPGSTYLGQIIAAGLPTAANAMLAAMAATTVATRADAIAANLGLTGTAATSASNYLQTVAFAGAASTHGQGLLTALDLFTTLQNDATFGTAATAYVARVNTALSYSSVAANNSTDLTTLAAAVGSAGSSGAGSTFTLTTGVDNPRLTSGNDTITGEISAASTFQVTDTIAAGDGTDTLTIFASAYADGDNAPLATTSGIEILNVRATDATAADKLTFNAGNFGGLTSFISDRSTSHALVTNLGTGATVSMNGNGTLTNGALSFGYKTAADAAVLNITNGTTDGAVAITSTPAAVTFNSTGAANIIGTVNLGGSATGLTVNATTGLTFGAITAAALKTITITGAAATAATPVTPAANDITSAVQIGTLSAAVTTIDASAMTAGGVSATLIAGITSFKGGAGTDTVTSANTTLQTASIIDAGAGTDVLRVGAYADINSATKAKTYANFEILDSLALTGTAIDMSLFTNSTITGLRSGAAAESSFSNVTAAQAGNVTIYGNQGTTSTYALAGATGAGQIDTLKIAITDGLTAKNTLTVQKLVASGVENIEITATDNATFADLTGLTAMSSFKGAGGGNYSLTTGALATVANTTYDFSAVTGTVTFTAAATTGTNGLKFTGSSTKANTLTGTANADVLIGGAGDDSISNQTTAVTASAGDVITGGAGNDTFTLRGDSASAATYVGSSRITDFSVGTAATTSGVSGTDVLTLNAAKANYGGAGTNFAGGVAAAAAGATAIQSVVVNSGAAAYAAAADLIKLTTGVAAGANLQATFNAAIGTSTVTGLGAGEEIFVTFYDTTNSRMIVAIVDAGGAGTNTIVETGDTVTLVGSLDMNAADYALFSNANLAIV